MIFVDANVFLDFFEKDMPQFHTLIDSLTELRGELFITDRVAKEVRRKKVRVAARAMDRLLDRAKLPAIRLPPHLDDSADGEYTKLNTELAQAYEAVKALQNRLKAVRNHLVGQIARSEDQTSLVLEGIFAQALQATPEQMSRAVARHQCGDPPGKMGGPIGDQVSWEQLLDAYDPNEHLCIVTRDADYFEDIGGSLVLNPLLAQELGARGSLDKVRVFSRLVDALVFVGTLPGMRSVAPQGPDAEEIRREEDTSGTLHSTGPHVAGNEADPVVPFANLARALREASSDRGENESILHYLLRGESVSRFDDALKRGVDKLAEKAVEIHRRENNG